MTTLNLLTSILAYDDQGCNTNNNPTKRVPDYAFQALGLKVNNSRAEHFSVSPNTSLTIYSGVRTTNISAITTFSLSLTAGSTYRVTATGGTPPAFKTARVTAVDATTAFSVTINNGALVTLTNTAGTAPDFSTVIPGDKVYIGPSTSFNVQNRGYFTILAKTSNSISFSNPLAVAETGILLNSSFATDFQVYANDNVQVGDTLVISAGFSVITQGNYTITAVTPIFLEFVSTAPLPLETGIQPGAAGITIYSASKFYLFMTSDQAGAIQLNGDSTNNVKIEPINVGNSLIAGTFQKVGTSYQVVFKNLSLVNTANIFVFSAEK